MIGAAGKLNETCKSDLIANAAATEACKADVTKYLQTGGTLASSGGFAEEFAKGFACNPSAAFQKALQANTEFAASHGRLMSILCLGDNNLLVADVYGQKEQEAATPAPAPALAPDSAPVAVVQLPLQGADPAAAAREAVAAAASPSPASSPAEASPLAGAPDPKAKPVQRDDGSDKDFAARFSALVNSQNPSGPGGLTWKNGWFAGLRLGTGGISEPTLPKFLGEDPSPLDRSHVSGTVSGLGGELVVGWLHPREGLTGGLQLSTGFQRFWLHNEGGDSTDDAADIMVWASSLTPKIGFNSEHIRFDIGPRFEYDRLHLVGGTNGKIRAAGAPEGQFDDEGFEIGQFSLGLDTALMFPLGTRYVEAGLYYNYQYTFQDRWNMREHSYEGGTNPTLSGLGENRHVGGAALLFRFK